MSIDEQKINYYKRKQAGKGTIGLFLDTLFFDMAIFLLSFLLLLRTMKLFIPSLIIAAAVTLLLDYLMRYSKSRRLEKYVMKELISLRHELLIEKIILKSAKDKRKIVINTTPKKDVYAQTKDPYIFTKDGEKIFVDMLLILPPKKATIDNIVSSVEYMKNKNITKALIASTTSFDDDSKALIKKIGLDIRLIEQDKLLESAMDLNIIVLDEELKNALDKKIEKERITRKRFLALATNSKNIKRFSLFGAFLFLLASFTPFRTYYYTAAAACLIFAILIYLYNAHNEDKDSAEI